MYRWLILGLVMALSCSIVVAQPLAIKKIYENNNIIIAEIPISGNITNIYNVTNITQGVTNNITYKITNNYTVNETEPSFNANISLFNPFYNQTLPAITWVQNQNYRTNFYEQDPNYFSNPFNFINSSYNASYLTSSFNMTYDAKPSNVYNTSYEYQTNTTLAQNISNYYQFKVAAANVLNPIWQTGTELINTSTEMKTAINDTANNYFQIKSNESRYVSCTGIYGGTDADYCTDATGAGSGTSFAQYNFSSINTISNTTTWNDTLTLTLTGGKYIEIECVLFSWANATATGIQLWTNMTGQTKGTTMIRYPTSATALAICSEINNTVCAGATSAGPVIVPTEIYSYINQSTNGVYKVYLKTEVAGPKGFVNLTAGSWCRSIESATTLGK